MQKIIFILLILILSISCHKDFEEINTNPNSPIEVEPDLLLRQIIYNLGEELSYEGFVAGNLLGQYFTMVDFNLFDRHRLSDPQLGGNPWPVLYKNLRDNDILFDLAVDNTVYDVYRGPSLILKAYMAAILTDLYGDVPYTEALKGTEGLISPKYDSQEDIYTSEGGILDNLEKGVDILKNQFSNTSLKGDLLYSGNLESWVKLGNSLMIKYLMRISDRVDVSEKLTDIIADGQFMMDNSDNAYFDFSADRPNSFRMQQLRDGDFNLFILSQTMDSILTSLNDPRLRTFFRPIGAVTNDSIYRGLRNGPDASTTSISVADYSLAGKIFREETQLLDATFLTAWEIKFLLAEASLKGFLSGSAQSLYEEGVQMAFDFWQTSFSSDYLLNGPAAWGNSEEEQLNQIITQKYVANIINGYEGWVEFRRTGFPKLLPISASLNNNLIPTKMPYPAEEQTLNKINFDAATNGDGNSINKLVWWDVQ